jgi:hypothetical protein
VNKKPLAMEAIASGIAKYRRSRICDNSHPNAISADLKHGDYHVVANHQVFTLPSGKYEHCPAPHRIPSREEKIKV